jgi:hypothetical protein
MYSRTAVEPVRRVRIRRSKKDKVMKVIGGTLLALIAGILGGSRVDAALLC